MLKRLLKDAQIESIPVSINSDLIGKEYMLRSKKIINVITEEDFLKIASLKDLPYYLDNTRKWILIGLMIFDSSPVLTVT